MALGGGLKILEILVSSPSTHVQSPQKYAGLILQRYKMQADRNVSIMYFSFYVDFLVLLKTDKCRTYLVSSNANWHYQDYVA